MSYVFNVGIMGALFGRQRMCNFESIFFVLLFVCAIFHTRIQISLTLLPSLHIEFIVLCVYTLYAIVLNCVESA